MSIIRWSLLGTLLVTSVNATAAAEDQEVPQQLEVGDRALDFDLPRVGGDEFINLRDEYKQGPVAVVVLRGFPGYQCPLCRQQLSAMRNRAGTLAKHVRRVILVYPGEGPLLQRHADQFRGSRPLPEPLVLVRDPDMQMVNQWGLRWNRDRETAYPAAYIIDRNGRVRWSKVSDNHGGRASVEELLRELRKLR